MPDYENPQKIKLSIAIPVYNEKDTMMAMLERVTAVDLSNKKIIVVGEGSQDGTPNHIIWLKPDYATKLMGQGQNYYRL